MFIIFVTVSRNRKDDMKTIWRFQENKYLLHKEYFYKIYLCYNLIGAHGVIKFMFL